jgi:phosphoribosylformylglycinamidine cyclo-ligase
MMDKHDTIGQDLVNHCVNDILVCGAKPLFFMDYFATGRLKNEIASEVVGGFVKACKENKCALIGGETAEMPGLYEKHVYDLSGTIVGVVERGKMIVGKGIKAGDVLLGLPSTGLHTNGYSLARKVLLSKFALNDYVGEIEGTLGQVLLRIHRSYLNVVSSVLKEFTVKGLSHITGGGIAGNTMRVIPKGLSLRIDWSAWERPAIFNLLQRVGNVPERDMRSALNLGIGLVMVVSKRKCEAIARFVRKIGEVIRSKR